MVWSRGWITRCFLQAMNGTKYNKSTNFFNICIHWRVLYNRCQKWRKCPYWGMTTISILLVISQKKMNAVTLFDFSLLLPKTEIRYEEEIYRTF